MKSDIVKVIRSFRAGVVSKRTLINELTSIILKIPAVLGYPDKDIRHDFYAEIISRIEKIISLYKEIPSAAFSTWFNHVLKMEFYGFIKKRNKKEFEYAAYSENSIMSLYDSALDEGMNGEMINTHYDILTKKEKRVLDLKLGFSSDTAADAESLNIIFGKLDKKKHLEDKIGIIYLKILNLQKNISFETEPEIKNELKLKEERLKRRKRRLEKDYNRLIVTPTNEWVGDKLGISKNTAAAFLSKIKNKMQKAFSEYEYSGV